MHSRTRSLLPTLATFGNLMAGFFALLFAARGDFAHAAALVAVAAVFDLLDGAFARYGASENCQTRDEIGTNLDSLADVVSFGAVPAFALHQSTLYDLPATGLAVCVFFLACGAWRLARFPLLKNPEYFVGLPIPPAGVALALLAVLDLPALLAAVAAVVLGALMVSTLTIPIPSAIRRPKKRTL